MAYYLITYEPLCVDGYGRKNIVANKLLQPYVDRSCRREPDFEHPFPGISTLCRKGKFAPRLEKGDTVAYLTKCGDYHCDSFGHGYRVVDILEIIDKVSSHQAAAEYYADQQLRLPSNCMVDGNPPFEKSSTSRGKKDIRDDNNEPRIRAWDHAYKLRADDDGTYVICKHLIGYPKLTHPLFISREDFITKLGNPGTLNPHKKGVGEKVWKDFLQLI